MQSEDRVKENQALASRNAPAPQEVLGLDQRDPRAAERLWHGLSPEQRLATILAAEAADRERLITLARDSGQLVRALAVDEFASTVLEVGPEDATGLLALASQDQVTFLLDLTGWVEDRFAPTRYESWVPLFLEAGADLLVSWLKSTDVEVLTLLFAHWFRVEKYLASQDEQEPPDDLPEFTLDGVYFLEFHSPQKAALVAQVLVALKSEDPDRYTLILEAMAWESAAMLAEDAARFRKGRMADLGFPDRSEALEIWAHPIPGEEDWQNLAPKDQRGFAGGPPRSRRWMDLLPQGAHLPEAASRMGPEQVDSLLGELAYVANCAAVALGADPADPGAVRKAGMEGLGLANLGLGILSQGDPARASAIVARVGLAALARQGAKGIRQLNQRAWALAREGWLAGMPGGLTLLDHPQERYLAGLLFSHPRFYDPPEVFDQRQGEEKEYRPFLNLSDLNTARRWLALAEYSGILAFERFGLDREQMIALIRERKKHPDLPALTMNGVMLTWLARQRLGLPGLAAIPAEMAGEAVVNLQQGLAGGLGRELFEPTESLPAEEGELARDVLRRILGLASQELGGLDPAGPLEARYIGGLAVEG